MSYISPDGTKHSFNAFAIVSIDYPKSDINQVILNFINGEKLIVTDATASDLEGHLSASSEVVAPANGV